MEQEQPNLPTQQHRRNADMETQSERKKPKRAKNGKPRNAPQKMPRMQLLMIWSWKHRPIKWQDSTTVINALDIFAITGGDKKRVEVNEKK